MSGLPVVAALLCPLVFAVLWAALVVAGRADRDEEAAEWTERYRGRAAYQEQQ